MEKTINLILIFSIFVLIISLNSIQASGSLLTPKMIIRVNVDSPEGVKIEKAIGVSNDENYPLSVSLDVSDGIKDIIELEEEKFILGVGEEKWINFSLDIKKAGEYFGEIIVVFSAEDKQAIGLASQIIIFAEGDEEETSSKITGAAIGNLKDTLEKPLTIIIISCIIIFIILFFYYRRHLSKKDKRLNSSKRVMGVHE